jgi:hypothetical protein
VTAANGGCWPGIAGDSAGANAGVAGSDEPGETKACAAKFRASALSARAVDNWGNGGGDDGGTGSSFGRRTVE